MQELHSIEEVTRRLGGVSKWSVYSWLSQGKLRKTKIGSRVMVAESDLLAFIAACNPKSDEQRKEGENGRR